MAFTSCQEASQAEKMGQISKTKSGKTREPMPTTQGRRISTITNPDMGIHNMNVEGYDACNTLFCEPNVSVEGKGRGC
jgi:hypothetical protein